MALVFTPEDCARETANQRVARAAVIADRLADHYDGHCALIHRTPWELLVATILSAQCTDEKVNKVTPDLFAAYPDVAAFAAAPPEAIEPLINSLGLFRNKAKSLHGAAERLVDVYNGELPTSLEELITLPGVARKTANVVLGTAFGIPSGFVVDTHVQRLSHRMGLSAQKDTGKIERDLMALFAKDRWIATGHNLVLHGRRQCSARKPLCDSCPLADVCPQLEGKPA